MQQEGNLNLHLYYIRHRATNTFLKGSVHPFPKSDTQYICTSVSNEGVYNFWLIEKVTPYSPELRHGDLVNIRNFATQLYIHIDPSKKAECTNQALAYLGEGPIPFLMQQAEDTMKPPKPVLREFVSDSPIRLIHAESQFKLHSHDIRYKNQHMRNYNEVTGWEEQDQNDLWELVPVSSNEAQSLAGYVVPPLNYQKRYIKDGDQVRIRNLWTGQTLHSHSVTYKVSKVQEVTAFNFPRDANDTWIVYQKEANDRIQNSLPVKIKHVQTDKFLSVVGKNQTKSNRGQQVTCVTQTPQLVWLLVTLDSLQVDVDVGFYILLPSQSLYLGITDSKSETSTSQAEVALVSQINSKCIWFFEPI